MTVISVVLYAKVMLYHDANMMRLVAM